MCNNISKSLADGKAVIGILIDLSKASDTVNHNILLEKLNYLSIHGVALQFIYLLLVFFIYRPHVLTPWSGRQVHESGA